MADPDPISRPARLASAVCLYFTSIFQASRSSFARASNLPTGRSSLLVCGLSRSTRPPITPFCTSYHRGNDHVAAPVHPTPPAIYDTACRRSSTTLSNVAPVPVCTSCKPSAAGGRGSGKRSHSGRLTRGGLSPRSIQTIQDRGRATTATAHPLARSPVSSSPHWQQVRRKNLPSKRPVLFNRAPTARLPTRLQIAYRILQQVVGGPAVLPAASMRTPSTRGRRDREEDATRLNHYSIPTTGALIFKRAPPIVARLFRRTIGSLARAFPAAALAPSK